MNLLLCLLLATQKPGTSQPNITGWEVPAIMGVLIGLAIAKFGVQDSLPKQSVKSNTSFPGNSITPQVSEVAHVESKPTPNTQCPTSDTQWVQNLVKQTALIWGNQGGGKSWLTRYVIKLKVELGYKVIVLDPDSNRSEWNGVESYHSWEDIENQIAKYVDELRSRLEKFNNSSISEAEWRKSLWDDGEAIALICEEATTYGDFIKNESLLEMFGKLALTKSRKQEMPVTIVSHNNTQTCMFGIKGFYNLVSKMLQIECLAEVDPVTLQPKSTGKARVKLDSSVDWLLVELPKMEAKISEFKSKNVFAPVSSGAIPDSPIHPKGEVELTATDVLPEPLRTIWRAAQKEGNWLTARDVARKEYAALKGRNTAAEIVAVVQKLEQMGLVEVNKEGQAIRFRVSQSH